MPKKMTLAQLHMLRSSTGERSCGCSLTENPNQCPFQEFNDNWDFTPEVGNSKGRGEVFTPRFIVDQMLAEAEIFPTDAIYGNSYSTVPKKKMLEYVTSTVNEPAVGTGNFLSTILWHKIHYAYQAALKADGILNQRKYDLYVTQAVASIYANDIDCGNLQTVKNRLLYRTDINSPENVEFWLQYLHRNITSFTRRTKAGKVIPSTKWKQSALSVNSQVRKALTTANKNWGEQANKEGLIERLYAKHTQASPTGSLIELWKNVLDENIKLFNGIAQHDTLQGEDITEPFFCPGWQYVEWKIWAVKTEGKNVILDEENSYPVRLAEQIYNGELRTAEKELQAIEGLKEVDENDLSLTPTFRNPTHKRQYLAKQKEIERIHHRYETLLKETIRTEEVKEIETGTPEYSTLF